MVIQFFRTWANKLLRREDPIFFGYKTLCRYLQQHDVDVAQIPDTALRELVQDAYQKHRFFSVGSHTSPEKAYRELLELYAYQIRQLLRTPPCPPSEYQYYSSTRAVLERHGLFLCTSNEKHRRR